jgi:MoxR-like ATPase
LDEEITKLNAVALQHSAKLGKVKAEIGRTIVGQEEVIDRVLMALICEGNVLLEGVPGLAKTLLIKTLSDTTSAKFSRIQFTPDLLPADIVGTKIYNHKDGSFTTKKGPVFANFILADEINRAPPKVQSALLEAMQEKQVTIGGDTYELEKPFLVMATQNPIETEGTYRLPEAQVDRFMFQLLIRYPSKSEEKEIISRMTEGIIHKASKVLTVKEIIELQRFVPKVYADDRIKHYVTELVDATRNPAEYGLELHGMIEWGASPRASIWMILAAKAHAVMQGRAYVLPEDVKAVAGDVLRHRIITSYEADAEKIKSDDIIIKILERIKVP